MPESVDAATWDAAPSASALASAAGSPIGDLSDQVVVACPEIRRAPQSVVSMWGAAPRPSRPTMSGAPELIANTPLHLGQTTMSPTRAIALPWMSLVKSALMTVPPCLIFLPMTTNGRIMVGLLRGAWERSWDRANL